MNKPLTILVAGLVGIGMATAVLAPGRQTIGVTKAAGSAGSGLFRAAEGNAA